MDFHTLSRKDLQALCKKYRIPANITNVAMADALEALQMVEGIEELQEALKFQSPKTIQRTGSQKTVGPTEDQASPLPRSRRVTARAPGVLNLVDEEEKKDVAETPKVPPTRRRTRQKDEINETVKSTRMSTGTSAIQGVETQKEEKLVGLTTGRRTRGAVKKEVDLMSGGVVRSSRARGITTMASLAKEEVEEEKVETGEVVVETNEEKVDDKEEQEEEQVDDMAEKVDEIDDKAEHDKVDVKAGDIVEQQNDLCYETMAVETKNEGIDDVAEVKETNDIMEGEIKSFDQTYCHDLIMSEDGFLVDQMSDPQSEEMVVETSKEDKLHDKAAQEEPKELEEEESEEEEPEELEVEEIDDRAVEKLEEKLEEPKEIEEEEIDDQADEKLDDNVRQEEVKIDDQAEDKVEDKPEEEEEQIYDQTEEEEEEREMESNVEEEIKSLEERMAVDEESVDQKNDIKYEEMGTVKVIQGEQLDDTTEKEVEEEEIDDQADEKLDDNVRQEEVKIDDQTEEKVEDKPEEEEEQIYDQTEEEEEEREMESNVEEEIKSLEERRAVEIKSLEEMGTVKVIQGEQLDDTTEKEVEEEQTNDHAEQEEEKGGFSHVEEMEECSELVEEVAIIKEVAMVTSDQTLSNEEQQTLVAEVDENETATNDEFPGESGKETGNIQIGELIDNLSDLNLSFKQEIRDLITSNQTSIDEEQHNPVAVKDENVKKSSGKENETATNVESGKETGNIQIGELIDNLLDLNLSFKEEIKADDGVLREEENNNKENSEMVKSKTGKKYESSMSLRKLKASYKEVLVSMNKGEEKRSALKVIYKNCI